jgi:aryl-alcohol dehydrogenase-like predicted oxidoreductase
VIVKQIALPKTDLTVSSFCYGMMPFGTRVTGEEQDRLLGVFRDAGGNFLDTAHCYACWLPGGDGASERAVGKYLRDHGCRDELVIATKGGHPSIPGYRTVDRFLSPGRISADIDDSLGRLGIDVIDLYGLHRDDPRVPVADIIETLNGEISRGRIRTLGGSNWTSARLSEANAYAEAHGLAGFVASQPSWSLAERTPFPNDQLSLNDTDRAWHARSGMPVVPYSPTGKGYFAGRTDNNEFNTELSRARLMRARALADDLDATPNQIALAWLRHQPFPVIPILGTADCDHLIDALAADDIELTEEQIRYLEPGN